MIEFILFLLLGLVVFGIGLMIVSVIVAYATQASYIDPLDEGLDDD